MYKEKIKELLLSTGRKGMDKLIEHMENEGFFTAPCSTRFHLAEEGGLDLRSSTCLITSVCPPSSTGVNSP